MTVSPARTFVPPLRELWTTSAVAEFSVTAVMLSSPIFSPPRITATLEPPTTPSFRPPFSVTNPSELEIDLTFVLIVARERPPVISLNFFLIAARRSSVSFFWPRRREFSVVRIVRWSSKSWIEMVRPSILPASFSISPSSLSVSVFSARRSLVSLRVASLASASFWMRGGLRNSWCCDHVYQPEFLFLRSAQYTLLCF